MLKDKNIQFQIKNKKQLNSLLNLSLNKKIGDIIDLETHNLPKGSHLLINVICDNCGKEKIMQFNTYYRITNGLKDNFFCNESICINKKRKISINKKYNVDNVFQLEEIKNKIKNTNLLVYGCENPQQNKIIKEKTENTNIKIYGFKNPFQNENIKKKICDTNLIKYGYKHPFQNLEFRSSKIKGRSSKSELQLLKFIEDNYDKEILKNKRNIIMGSEIDIYLPDLKLAFEFNGLYWHNEITKDKNYHLDKTNRCKEMGIELINIWEDQWEYQKDIVKSKILNKLDKIYIINSNNTILKEINDHLVISDFLNKNSINGYKKCKINIGLYHNNELISIMLFKKNKLNNYQLIDYCNKLNTKIINGENKIFNYFIKKYNPSKVISYISRDFINYDLYDNLKFKLESILKPNYYYVMGRKRENNKKLRKIEKEKIFERKIYKIYDSGSLKFTYINF